MPHRIVKLFLLQSKLCVKSFFAQHLVPLLPAIIQDYGFNESFACQSWFGENRSRKRRSQ